MSAAGDIELGSVVELRVIGKRARVRSLEIEGGAQSQSYMRGGEADYGGSSSREWIWWWINYSLNTRIMILVNERTAAIDSSFTSNLGEYLP